MTTDSSEPITFGSVSSEGDSVRYPCPSCSGSQHDFEWVDTLTAEEFPEHESVFETDAVTFLAINDYDEDEETRVFECADCGQVIAHLPKSGIQYVA